MPFERGLRAMQMSRDVGSAQRRRNKPINWWNVEHPGERRGPRKAAKCIPTWTGSAAGAKFAPTKASLGASAGSGAPSSVLWILIFLLGGYISLQTSKFLLAGPRHHAQ